MSRSRKKNNFTGITLAESEKKDKQIWHRTYRHVCNGLIRQGVYDMPHYREYSDPWMMDKDGKHSFDPMTHPELKRK